VQLQKFCHCDQECKKNVKLVAITKSHQEFSFIEIAPFTEKMRFEKSSEKNIFCNQPSPRCVNFLTRRHLALDWLLYSFFKGRTIFGRNNHKINLSKSGLLEQRCKYR